MFAKLFIAFLEKYGNESALANYHHDHSDVSIVSYHINKEFHHIAISLEYSIEVDPYREYAYIDIAYKQKNYTLYLKNYESEEYKKIKSRFQAEQYF